MRIVLDTNVLIAAFITRGVCADVFEHCARKHTLITSRFILREFREHLAGKFGFGAQDVKEAVELLRSTMEVVTPARLSAPVCHDRDDDKVLGTAVAARADCILTGDKDMLVIKRFRSVDILRPAEFAGYEAAKAETP